VAGKVKVMVAVRVGVKVRVGVAVGVKVRVRVEVGVAVGLGFCVSVGVGGVVCTTRGQRRYEVLAAAVPTPINSFVAKSWNTTKVAKKERN
jgi:hypothetical protein